MNDFRSSLHERFCCFCFSITLHPAAPARTATTRITSDKTDPRVRRSKQRIGITMGSWCRWVKILFKTLLSLCHSAWFMCTYVRSEKTSLEKHRGRRSTRMRWTNTVTTVTMMKRRRISQRNCLNTNMPRSRLVMAKEDHLKTRPRDQSWRDNNNNSSVCLCISLGHLHIAVPEIFHDLECDVLSFTVGGQRGRGRGAMGRGRGMPNKNKKQKGKNWGRGRGRGGDQSGGDGVRIFRLERWCKVRSTLMCGFVISTGV